MPLRADGVRRSRKALQVWGFRVTAAVVYKSLEHHKLLLEIFWLIGCLIAEFPAWIDELGATGWISLVGLFGDRKTCLFGPGQGRRPDCIREVWGRVGLLGCLRKLGKG